MEKLKLISDKYKLQFKVEVQIASGAYHYDELCDMQRMLDILCGCGYVDDAGRIVAEALGHRERVDWQFGDRPITEWYISHEDNPYCVFVGIHRFEEA